MWSGSLLPTAVVCQSATMPGFHHVAYACRDLQETTAFYEAMGFPLVHTEVAGKVIGTEEHFLRHVFFDTGDGSCIAFFDLHGVGEADDWRTDVSTGMGLPVWVNHVAFRADKERQDQARAALAAMGKTPEMELDHEWCHSLYALDPNGILIEFCRDTGGLPPLTDASRAEALAMITAIPD
jgi:glyoxylase I family protein